VCGARLRRGRRGRPGRRGDAISERTVTYYTPCAGRGTVAEGSFPGRRGPWDGFSRLCGARS
jgi:hypothetical protein